ncbi:MAG: hypothetical protein V1857_05625 [archaeon]
MVFSRRAEWDREKETAILGIGLIVPAVMDAGSALLQVATCSAWQDPGKEKLR